MRSLLALARELQKRPSSKFPHFRHLPEFQLIFSRLGLMKKSAEQAFVYELFQVSE